MNPLSEEQLSFETMWVGLKGPVVVEIEGVNNIAVPQEQDEESEEDEGETIETRYIEAEEEKTRAEKRTLKFLLNDGKQTFLGFEYE